MDYKRDDLPTYCKRPLHDQDQTSRPEMQVEAMISSSMSAKSTYAMAKRRAQCHRSNMNSVSKENGCILCMSGLKTVP